MFVSCSLKGHFAGNTCHCCAERIMINKLMELSRRKGNSPAQFTAWTYRKFGEMTIRRERADGQMGTSWPCVMCRKKLDKLKIPWRAHINEIWISSRDDNIPQSKPTQKQRIILKIKRP